MSKYILILFSLLFFTFSFSPAFAADEIISEKPLSVNSPVYSFKADGSAVLKGKNALVRAVLIDNNGKEYLLYETDAAAESSSRVEFNDQCVETCYLQGITPAKIRLEEVNAALTVANTQSAASLSQTGLAKEQLISAATAKKHSGDLARINKINNRLKNTGKKWTAGETAVSKFTYTQKRKIFSSRKNPSKILNLQGFEYYKGGVFETGVYNPSQAVAAATIRDAFDYRSFQGENWLTSVKDQGTADNAWVFSDVGAFESVINLYFNQHLNIDLSEQMFADCANDYTIPLGMNPFAFPSCANNNYCFPGSDYCVFQNHGLADEACDPYAARDLTTAVCLTVKTQGKAPTICADWQSRVWQPSGFMDYKSGSDFGTPGCQYQQLNLTDYDFKKALITKGPLNSGVLSLSYDMALIGYNKDATDSATIWIFKSSFGPTFGSTGYVSVKTAVTDVGYASSPSTPITPPTGTAYTVSCVDKDNDGYCNWGIGASKPSNCPTSCNALEDCDDSNPALGPYDASYNCTSLTAVTPTGSPSITPTPSLSPSQTLSKVNIQPASLKTFVGNDPAGLSALAYDGNGQPIWSGVTYDWGISSLNSVGSLLPLSGTITNFKPLNAGLGSIYVIAKMGTQSVTSGASVTVYAKEDINQDGVVNFLDLNSYLLNYGKNFLTREIISDGKTNLLDIASVLLKIK